MSGTAAVEPLRLGSSLAPLWDPEADDRLTCVATYAETHDVRTFVFHAPEGRRFAFDPGQFLTFAIETGGGTVNRCCSVSSSPLRPYTASITVKRVPGGVASNWLHDNMRPGARVQALGPMGTFSVARHPARKYLLLSAGSGITPMMSMTRALADVGAPVDVAFLHAARTPGDIVFRAELDLIARRLPGFRASHVPEAVGDEPAWAGFLGRISRELVSLAVPDVAERTVLCCGPGGFMEAARQICLGLGLPESNWHQESFAFEDLRQDEPDVAARVTDAEEVLDEVRTFKVTFAKLGREVHVRADRSVLAGAREAGLRLPSSCATGLCGTCKSKLVSGRVEMSHKGGIRQRDVDAGLFLPCCSKPLTDLVVDR